MSTPSNAVPGSPLESKRNRSCGYHCQPAHVLVGAARIVGTPFDLYRPAGRRRRFFCSPS